MISDYLQISMCVPWMPNKAGRHLYGYNQLAPLLDFFYIMDYGQGTWGCVNCTTATANSGLVNTIKGRFKCIATAANLHIGIWLYIFLRMTHCQSTKR